MTLQPLSKGKIWYYRGKIIVTDKPDFTSKNAVFPLCYENTYFAENLVVKKGDRVLDLCTGSGILAMFAAEKAEKVYAVDINKRALKFAKLNAELDGINNIEFLEGNLFEPVKGKKFDLITANPPFEPVPENENYYMHSRGGEKGTSILERILLEINDYLVDNGSFQIISWIPESKRCIFDRCGEDYMDFRVNVLQTYSPQQIQRHLQKRLKNKISFDESISLCFIQAFQKNLKMVKSIKNETI